MVFQTRRGLYTKKAAAARNLGAALFSGGSLFFDVADAVHIPAALFQRARGDLADVYGGRFSRSYDKAFGQLARHSYHAARFLGGRKLIAGVPGKRSSVQIEYPEDVPGAHDALLSEMKIHKNLRFWVMRFVLQPRFYSACSMPPSMRYTRPLVLRNRSGSQAVTMVWRCSIRLSR